MTQTNKIQPNKTQPTPPRALISGASIAGCALAYWLLQDGWHVTLVERAPRLRTGGYKIDLRGAAIRVTQRMGLLEQVQRHAVHMRESVMVNAAGNKIAQMPADDFAGRTGQDTELMRGDLVQVLADAVGGRATWLFGDQIQNWHETAQGVQVTFEHAPVQTFDLVFGADGIHSRTRLLTFGEETPFVHALGASIAVFTAPALQIPEQTEWVTAGPGWSMMLYRTPGEAPKALLLFKHQPGEVPTEVQAQKHWLKTKLLPPPGLGREVLAQLDAAPDFYCDLIAQISMPTWTKGRVALLGDAAYAPSVASGQGSSLAVVGAYVLAQSLQRYPGQHPLAFAAYEATMRPFVTANQKLAAANLPGMIPASRLALWFQLGMLRLLPRLPGKDRLVARILEPMQQAANAIELPEEHGNNQQ